MVEVYAVKHKDEDTRLNSRSGGAFSALSDWFLERDGVIYGCVMANGRARHIRTTNKMGRDKMRGSKYVQSSLGESFSMVEKDLHSGKQVLFTGTSCQVKGLQNYLGKEYSNLLCVDILCHGVPSPKVYTDYIKWQEKRNRKKIIGMDFRNKKKYGWADHVESLYFEDGNVIDSRIYTNMFYSLFIMRPCCYKCKFKGLEHSSDITLGDYWGIEKQVPEFYDNEGISLVLVNSKKGHAVLQDVKGKITLIQTEVSKEMMQQPLVKPYSSPQNRESFWKNYHNGGIQRVLVRYFDYGKVNDIKRLIRKIYDKLKE